MSFEALDATPPYIVSMVKGVMEKKMRLNVAFTKDVSGTFKLICGGKKVEIYVNDYRMIFKFITVETSTIREIMVYGSLTTKAFIGDKNPAISTLRIQAEKMIICMNRANGSIAKLLLEQKENHHAQETCKYYLMRMAYNLFEKKDSVITGQCSPDNLYDEIEKIHKRLAVGNKEGEESEGSSSKSKFTTPLIPRRNIEKRMADYMEKSNEYADKFMKANTTVQNELVDQDDIGYDMDQMEL
ncbi:hypothetical protein BD770DRAFT_449659 [Pilaira anomala]|nr:hypothetical protein BD770DRAFT_449659 [Pilaira anomala]